jgi:D-alanyl-D-alanine carboxypeptidase/D-alanyl-D-alanine-endopeptidase (penicillin-binding protein 4)
MFTLRSLVSTIALIFWLLLPFQNLCLAQMLPREKIQNGGYIISNNGNIIDQFRSNDLFVPASTIKLLTALTALDTLGEDFRFTTSFFVDREQVLYIRGSGDPTLTSEALALIARELKNRGLSTVSAYVLDDSAFQLAQPLPTGSANSSNPYDVPNSALAANFNSLAITKRKDGSLFSGEVQTPLTPLATVIGAKLPPGNHRVNIGSFHLPEKTGTVSLTLRYTAELLHTFLVQEGVASSLNIRSGTMPRGHKPLYEYQSNHTVKDMVESCMKFSNNYIANQLALAAGARFYGYPATWDKARRLLQQHALTELGISEQSLRIEEGSGLSRNNRITPAAMLKILNAFAPYRKLLPQKYGVLIKSGTLNAVYCYAGYIEHVESTVTFALFLNQSANTRDSLLESLKKSVSLLP